MGKREKWLYFVLVVAVLVAPFFVSVPTTRANGNGSDNGGNGVTAPSLSSLELLSKSDEGSYWSVEFEVTAENQPNVASVSRFEARAYTPEGAKITNSLYEDESFATGNSATGNSIDYEFTMDISRQDLDEVEVEACAEQGNKEGCTSYTFCIPSYTFSGGLDFTKGGNPGDEGKPESSVCTLTVDACGGRTITVDTEGTLLTQNLARGPELTIPTEWRAWDNKDSNGVIDLEWQTVSESGSETEIDISQDWEGEIYFQLRANRNGYEDHAGEYLASLVVDTSS